MTSPNANLTDDQRERNRLVFLLIEAVARASIPANREQINQVAHHMQEFMHEHQLQLVWFSSFEDDVKSDG